MDKTNVPQAQQLTSKAVLFSLKYALDDMRTIKALSRSSDMARYYAVAATELEKVIAFFSQYVVNGERVVPFGADEKGSYDRFDMVQGALDRLGVALADHNHQWTDEERNSYAAATNILKAEKEYAA